MDADQIALLLSTFDQLELSDLHDPETGLVMITALDCYQHPFHLGELLVTRAELEFDGIRAHATVMGDAAEKALLAAMLNAVLRHDKADTLSKNFLEQWVEVAAKARADLQEELTVNATTRVAFENMAEEEEI